MIYKAYIKTAAFAFAFTASLPAVRCHPSPHHPKQTVLGIRYLMLTITHHFHSIGAKTDNICAIVHDLGIDIRHKNLIYRISLKFNMDLN